MFKLNKGRAEYDLRKFYFTNSVVNASVVTVRDFAFPVGFDRFLTPNFG